MALHFDDAEELARELYARFPRKDPLTIRFPDLERWVLETPDFADPARAATPRLLERIQERWYALFDSATSAE